MKRPMATPSQMARNKLTKSQTNPLCDLRALHRPLCRTTLPCLKNHIKALFVSGVKCCRNRLEKEPPKWILAPSHDPLHQPGYVRSKTSGLSGRPKQ